MCEKNLSWETRGVLCATCLDERLSPFERVSRLPLDEIKCLTLGDIQKGYGEKGFGKNRNAAIRYYANLLNPNLKSDFGKCQKCSYSIHVELCHIKSISSFTDDSVKLIEINGEDNLLVLCKNHHWEFDNGILKLSDIPSR